MFCPLAVARGSWPGSNLFRSSRGDGGGSEESPCCRCPSAARCSRHSASHLGGRGRGYAARSPPENVVWRGTTQCQVSPLFSESARASVRASKRRQATRAARTMACGCSCHTRKLKSSCDTRKHARQSEVRCCWPTTGHGRAAPAETTAARRGIHRPRGGGRQGVHRGAVLCSTANNTVFAPGRRCSPCHRRPRRRRRTSSRPVVHETKANTWAAPQAQRFSFWVEDWWAKAVRASGRKRLLSVFVS